MAESWHIRGGRIVDPASGVDGVGDLFVSEGLIVPQCPPDAREIDASGRLVVPGLTDLHVHFRQPGNDEAETIETGTRAAARGGFTRVVTMPNTAPPVDRAERVAFQRDQADRYGWSRVLPSGCITVDRKGRQLCDLASMAQAGAIAFTDDGSNLADEGLLREALAAAATLHRPLMDHAVDPILAGRGVIHEGERSAVLGLPGIPSLAEVRAVERNIAATADAGGAMHIQHITAGDVVGLIADARKSGLNVSGEVTPHHLVLTDADVPADDADFKMNPPLRSAQDRVALIEGILSGTLEAFATDHAPHRRQDKERGLLKGPFGIVGLETAVGITYQALVYTGLMPVSDWVARWTVGPAKVLGLDPPTLAEGQPADLAIIDTEREWTVQRRRFLSKSDNTPFEGRKLHGDVTLTMIEGRIAWSE